MICITGASATISTGTSETINTSASEGQSLLGQLVDGDLLQKSEDISHTADLCCVANTSRAEGSQTVLHHGSTL